jgi:hypothetical protein
MHIVAGCGSEEWANMPTSGAQFSESPQAIQLASSQEWGRKYRMYVYVQQNALR